jgi:hypothetical protein
MLHNFPRFPQRSISTTHVRKYSSTALNSLCYSEAEFMAVQFR